jgi:spore germination protein GerM
MTFVALIVSGCGGAGTETSTSSSNGANTTTSLAVSLRTVFLVVNGPIDFTLQKVSVVDEEVASDLTDQVRLALAELFELTGTKLENYNRQQMTDLGTAVPQNININNVAITDGVVSIDLDDGIRLTSGSSSEESLFAQQLAHTALLDVSLTEVRVLINGQQISDLWGHLDWSLPITADPTVLQ